MSRSQLLASSSKDTLAKDPVAKSTVIQLSPSVVGRLRPAKLFKNAVEKSPVSASARPISITTVAFDDSGERCLTAGEDEAFVLWDAHKGKKIRTYYSRKYGIDHARFTHRSQNIVHASTKDHTVRYHSLHDNKYLSYFKGHTGLVRSLHMNPTNDTFLSAGDDGTVRLWDLRSSTCQGLLNDVGGSVVASFDNQGLVFAVACSANQTIMLFATATMDSAPFHFGPLIDVELAKISHPAPRPVFTSLSFSNDGKYILVGTSSDTHYVLDAFELVILRRLVGHRGLRRDEDASKAAEPRPGASGEELSWSADSRWVVSGSADGSICLWDMQPPDGKDKLETDRGHLTTLESAFVLSSDSLSGRSSQAVKFNPRYCMLAVAGSDLSFWMPAEDEDTRIAEGW